MTVFKAIISNMQQKTASLGYHNLLIPMDSRHWPISTKNNHTNMGSHFKFFFFLMQVKRHFVHDIVHAFKNHTKSKLRSELASKRNLQFAFHGVFDLEIRARSSQLV